MFLCWFYVKCVVVPTAKFNWAGLQHFLADRECPAITIFDRSRNRPGQAARRRSSWPEVSKIKMIENPVNFQNKTPLVDILTYLPPVHEPRKHSKTGEPPSSTPGL